MPQGHTQKSGPPGGSDFLIRPPSSLSAHPKVLAMFGLGGRCWLKSVWPSQSNGSPGRPGPLGLLSIPRQWALRKHHGDSEDVHFPRDSRFPGSRLPPWCRSPVPVHISTTDQPAPNSHVQDHPRQGDGDLGGAPCWLSYLPSLLPKRACPTEGPMGRRWVPEAGAEGQSPASGPQLLTAR